jgi:uncharacterized protein YcfL
VIRHVLPGAPTLEVAGCACEEAQLVDGEQDLVVDERRARLAGVSANSSARRSSSSAIRNSASCRSAGVVSPQVSKADAAAAKAASTSADDETGETA